MSPGFEGLPAGAPGTRRRARVHLRTLGMPWFLALVQALALIISSMIGLAIALFA